MVTADIVLSRLPAGSKKQAFHQIADAAAALCDATADSIFDALLMRERLGTTGIGGGVAIPHIRLDGIDKLYGVMAQLEAPVDFDAIDGQPVDIIFMLVAPAESKTTQHLKALAQVSRFLKDAENCKNLRSAECRDSLTEFLLQKLGQSAA
ncbi:MAG: PTS sugar transporter subunit IIA [Alphaproteobacteria bacterium]|nr:PTS sugar transporter subunit IIA [Alphaproteobacteria bacterium]